MYNIIYWDEWISISRYIQSIDSYTGRLNDDNWLEVFYLLYRPIFTQWHKTSIACCHFSKLSNPLVKNWESQPLLVLLHHHAVVNDNLTKVIPLRNMLGKVVEISNLFFFIVNEVFDLLKKIEELSIISCKLV